MGDTPSTSVKGPSSPLHVKAGPGHLIMPVDIKDKIMFRPDTCSAEVLSQSERLNATLPALEVQQFGRTWMPVRRDKWAVHITAPVMFTLVEDDPFFESTENEAEKYKKAFSSSSRVDTSLVPKAPHCMELSYWSQGWYARCFGFAMECSASLGLPMGK
ncbi:hypothetical protein BJY01DRAFT_239541 [Aspergillus pseudoustus]|uniref:Alpha/beta hydrolase fold-3 domain-containing protein n=1 Tax=Aspergillus pseudoustus TaxID=1810923 RepID=A0ABR4IZF3_9EURO